MGTEGMDWYALICSNSNYWYTMKGPSSAKEAL